MSLYKIFGTDDDLERNGFALQYGGATFIIARAGGANEKFQRTHEKKIRPYRSAINSGTMHEPTARKLLAETYAETVILAWENVTDENDAELEFSRENVVKVLLDLPDLFQEILNESQRIANFVKAEAEADAKS